MAGILIKNGRVWNGEEFLYADVLTDGEYIYKIAKNITDHADFEFDATGMIVSPGLVDLHVHLKGIAPKAYGIQAEMSSFPFGVTAVNDAGSIHGDRFLLDSFAVKNTVFVGTDILNNHADLSNAELLLVKYGDKAIGVKVVFDKTISDVCDISPLKEICDYARARDLKVMVHCSHSPVSMKSIIEELSPGDILTHAYHGGKNSCCDNDFEAFAIARKKGVIIDSGFAGYVHTNFKNFEDSIKMGYLPDTISTDITVCSAYRRGGRYGMTMCMSIAKELGMDEHHVFKAVTSNPAEALGKGSQWGRLLEGRTADIAVFQFCDEGFSLTDNSGHCVQNNSGYRCVLTLCDGQVVYRR